MVFDPEFSLVTSEDINPEEFELKELLEYCEKVLISEKKDGKGKYWIQVEGINKNIAEIFGIDSTKISLEGKGVKEGKLEWGYWED